VKTTMCLIALVTMAGSVPAADPQVEFTVTDGWVEFRLTRDDRPVSGARVLVTDARGQKFADGATGEDGAGEFPIPPGSKNFRIEFRIDDRIADSILLTPVDGIVVPTNVLLSFGLAPCCRAPAKRTESLRDSPSTHDDESSHEIVPTWLRAGVGVTITLLGVAILFRRLRLARSSNHDPRKAET